MNEQAILRIGTASCDITPPVGARLVGYHSRQSTSLGHRLRAEVLVARCGEHSWALVTADLCAFSQPFANMIREAISARIPLPVEAILLAGNHTHSGPEATHAGWRLDHPDVAYFDTLAKTLVDAVVEAWNSATPGHFEAAVTTAPELGSNRRVQDADGHWYNDWTDPNGTHTGVFDATVTLTGVRRDDGKLDALLVTYGCHPVVLGAGSLAISADYCGYLKDALEDDGSAGTVFFGVSGHGDIDPRICVQSEAAEAERMGHALADIVRRAIPQLRPLADGVPMFHSEPWPLTRTRTIDETPEQQIIRLNRAGQVFETAVTAVRAGELAIIGMPGETVNEIATAIRTTSPYPHTLVFSCVNDLVGYIPTDTIQRQGSHEVNFAPATELEGIMLAKAAAALHGVRG